MGNTSGYLLRVGVIKILVQWVQMLREKKKKTHTTVDQENLEEIYRMWEETVLSGTCTT